eukprot:TRINITY_DN7179_c0_g1_i12.p2 TRINITY_DN7179_c0_g1~~TRINITY_DN7179_c0_g1_i12.p2  ORF type:complete len:138 (+),score=1.40 TRINITY_DN7179_c0_g1_i12:257-670(+)
MGSYPECRKETPVKSLSPGWPKPEKKLKDLCEDSPGPGSYETKDSFVSSSRAIKFSTRGRDVAMFNKGNNLLVASSNEPVPGVGTYFRSNFFKWNYNNYPSKDYRESRLGVPYEQKCEEVSQRGRENSGAWRLRRPS